MATLQRRREYIESDSEEEEEEEELDEELHASSDRSDASLATLESTLNISIPNHKIGHDAPAATVKQPDANLISTEESPPTTEQQQQQHQSSPQKEVQESTETEHVQPASGSESQQQQPVPVLVVEEAQPEVQEVQQQANPKEQIQQAQPQQQEPVKERETVAELTENVEGSWVDIETSHLARLVEAKPPTVESVYPDLEATLEEEGMLLNEYGIPIEDVALTPIAKSRAQVAYMNGLLLNENQVLNEFGKKTDQMDNKFYQLVERYLQSQKELYIVEHKIRAAQEEINNLFNQLYTFTTVQYISPPGYCQDNSRLTGNVTATKATFIPENAAKLKERLLHLRRQFYEDMVEAQYRCKVSRLKIEAYLESLFNSPLFKDIDLQPPSPAARYTYYRNDENDQYIAMARNCIKVLFTFDSETSFLLYNKDESEANGKQDADTFDTSKELKAFSQDIRRWARQTVSYLLRVASVDDHRFIIFNAIRLRYVGDWASDLVQVPEIRDDSCVDFFIAFLSVFLTPIYWKPPVSIEQANSITTQFGTSPPQINALASSSSKDLDGKEFVLTEDDYLAIWQQFPFFDLVDYLFVKSKAGSQQGASSFKDWNVTFNVVETILYILQNAIDTFDTVSHRQFSRQIAVTVARYLQIATAILLYGTEHVITEDLQNKFNDFFIKCFNAIFRSPNKMLWSFLNEYPYEAIANTHACAIFWSIFSDDGNSGHAQNVSLRNFASLKAWIDYNKREPHLRERFASMMANADHRGYHLVPVLAKLATSHSETIASIICYELFHVAYVANQTRKTYYKTVTPSLAFIMDKHPKLISLLLNLVKSNFKFIDKYSLSLFQSVKALDVWVPSIEDDLHDLRGWLLTKLESSQNQLAMYILEHLGWSGSHLPPQLHRAVALLLVEAASYHKTLWYGYLAHTFQKFSQWCRSLMLRLQAHNAKGDPLVPTMLLSDPLLSTIKLNIIDETTNDIIRRESNSGRGNNKKDFDTMSGYVALLHTEYGHDIVLFNASGRHIVKNMVLAQQFDYVIRVLCEVSLSIINSQFNMGGSNNNNSLQISPFIESCMQNDQSYFSYNKNTVGTRTIQLFECVKHTIRKCFSASREVASALCVFWVKELFGIDKWETDIRCLYGINELCRVAMSLNIFDPLIRVLLSKQKEFNNFALEKPKIFSFSAPAYPAPLFVGPLFSSNLIKPVVEQSFLALFLLLGLSHEETAQRVQVAEQIFNNRTPVEKAAGALIGGRFSVYRLLGYALAITPSILKETSAENNGSSVANEYPFEWDTLLLYFWQAFFCLYFEGIGHQSTIRFFGFYFLSIKSSKELTAEITNRLRALSQYYEEGAKSFASQLREQIQHQSPTAIHTLRFNLNFFSKMKDIYLAMLSWMIETLKNFSSFIENIPRLPDHFNAAKLASVINEKVSQDCSLLWSDMLISQPHFVDGTITGTVANVNKAVNEKRSLVLNVFPQDPSLINASSKQQSLRKKSLSSKQYQSVIGMKLNIDRLKEEEKQRILAMPPIVSIQVLGSGRGTLTFAEFDPSAFKSAARVYAEAIKKHTDIDNEYIGILPTLYINQEKTTMLELRCARGRYCSGPAMVVFSYQDKAENTRAFEGAATNRSLAERLFKADYLSDPLCILLLKLDNTMELYQAQRNPTQEFTIGLKAMDSVVAEAIRWFYLLLACYDVEVASYPPLKVTILHALQSLGNAYIANNNTETANLLTNILESPSRVQLLHSYFNPLASPESWTPFMLSIFEAQQRLGESNVMTLLNKFDVDKWLQFFPPIALRQSLLNHCGEALISLANNWNQSPNHRQSADNNHGKSPIEVFYINMFLKLASFNFPELYNDSLEIIFKGIACCKMASAVVEAYAQLPLSFLSIHQLKHTFQFMSSKLWEIRKAMNATLYESSAAAYIPGTMKIISTILHTNQSLIDEHSQSNVSVAWEGLCSVFEPFIFTIPAAKLYNSNHIDKNAIVLPWNKQCESEAANVVFAFVELVNTLQKSNVYTINNIWMLYSQILYVESPSPMLSVFHQQFLKLGWASWVPNIDNIWQMVQVVKGGKGGSHDFIKRVMYVLRWTDIEKEAAMGMNLIASTDTSSMSRFYLGVGVLILELLFSQVPLSIGSAATTTEDAFVVFVTTLLTRLRWSKMDLNGFSELLNQFYTLVCQGAAPIDANNNNGVFISGSSVANGELFSYAIIKAAFDLTSAAMAVPEDQPTSVEAAMTSALKLQSFIRFSIHLYSFALAPVALPPQQQQVQMQPPQQQSNVRNKRAIAKFFETEKAKFFVQRVLGNITNLQKQGISIEMVSQLVQECLHVFNFKFPEFDDWCDRMLEFINDNPSLALAFLISSTRTITSIQKLSQVIEQSIQSYFLVSNDWHAITTYLEVPQLDKQQFIEECKEGGFMLTLYAYSVQRAHRGKDNLMNIKRDLLDFILKTNNTVQQREHLVLLLWYEFLRIFIAYKVNTPYPHMDAIRTEYEEMNAFVDYLMRLSGENAGLITKIMGAFKKNYSPSLRLLARLFGTYLATRVMSDSQLRWGLQASGNNNNNNNTSNSRPISLTPEASKLYDKLWKQLEKLKQDVPRMQQKGLNNSNNTAEYNAMVLELELTNYTMEFIRTNSNAIGESVVLLQHLVTKLYPNISFFSQMLYEI